MSIKSKHAALIYSGCILCQSIDDLIEALQSHGECKKLLGDSLIKRVIAHKEKWLDCLSAEDKG